MPPLTDATSAIYALDSMLPFAEVRPATDLVKDPWGPFIDLLAKARTQQQKAPVTTSVKPNPFVGEPITSEVDPPLAGMNPWLVDTINIIDAYRQHLISGSRDANVRSLLETAEILASFIAEVGPRRRPQLNIEPSGRPTFATVTNEFYIHLTVDQPKRITWYAVVRGAEYFNEGVAFDGRRFPAELTQLFSL